MGTIQAKCLILKASRWIVHPMWTGYDLHGEQRPATGHSQRARAAPRATSKVTNEMPSGHATAAVERRSVWRPARPSEFCGRHSDAQAQPAGAKRGQRAQRGAKQGWSAGAGKGSEAAGSGRAGASG